MWRAPGRKSRRWRCLHPSSPPLRRALEARRNLAQPAGLRLMTPNGWRKLAAGGGRAMICRLVLMGFMLCVGSAASAEMLQFSTPEGMKSWPKLNDPPDWHQDQESSQRLNANFLIPDGVDPANAEVTIQARGFPRINNSLANLLEEDRAALP